MTSKHKRCLGSVLAGLLVVPAAAFGQDFQIIENATWLDAISADGRYVAGVGNDSQPGAFRYHTDTGVREIIGIGRPRGITADGTAIVGSSDAGAFLWTEAEGFINLRATVSAFAGDTPALAISDDGVHITGDTRGGDGFRYSRTGSVLYLENCSTPYDISGDGSVIAGGVKFTGEIFLYAGVWDDAGQLTDFREEAEATVISADGRYACGGDGSTRQPFRWSADGGFELLDTLPDSLKSLVWGVSADGSRLAGYMIVSSAPSGLVSFVWEEGVGTRTLKSFLEDEYGFDLDGWELTLLMSMSDDGRSFAGRAIDPSGAVTHYVARIGESCVADLDGDGELTLFDFIEFQNMFGMGDLAADLDGDGALTIFDFLEFQSFFAVGC